MEGRLLGALPKSSDWRTHSVPPRLLLPFDRLQHHSTGNRYNRWVFSTGTDSRAQRFAHHLYDFTWQAKRIELKPTDSALFRPTDGGYRFRSGAEMIGADGALQLASNTQHAGTL